MAIWEEIVSLLQEGSVNPIVSEIAKHLGIDRGTLYHGIKKHIDPNFKASDLEEMTVEFAGVYQRKNKNDWTIGSNDPSIHTLEQLLEHCRVDLDVWRVERWVANAWPTTGRAIEMDLKYQVVEDKKGNPKTVTEGYKKVDGLKSKSNVQIKAWLVRIDPIPVFPVLRPLTISVKFAPPRPSKRKGVYRSLAIGDPHVSFLKDIHTDKKTPTHDRRALDVALQILESKEFDDVTILGDSLDLSEWSTKFVIRPEFAFTTMPALIEWHWWLAQMRKVAPNAVIDDLQGNHDRIDKALISHFPAAYGLREIGDLEGPPLLSIEKLLGLEQLHIGYIKGYEDADAVKWVTDTFAYQHGNVARGVSGATAHRTSEIYWFTTGFGHIHRRELVAKKKVTKDGPVFHTAFCPGTVAHIDGRVPGSKQSDQWQQGVAVVEYDPQDPEVEPNIDIVAISNGRAIFDGQVFEARALDEELDSYVNEELEKIGTKK